LVLVYLCFCHFIRCVFQLGSQGYVSCSSDNLKKDLEDCCELVKNRVKGECLSLHSFERETEVFAKIKLVKAVISFDPEEHILAFFCPRISPGRDFEISFNIEHTAYKLFTGSSRSKSCADHPVLSLQKGKFLQPDRRVRFLPPLLP